MGDEHHGGVELDERALQPLQRLDVEMVGGLVEQQHVGAGGERTRERGARELPTGERVEAAVEIRVGEPQTMRHHGGAIAPQIPAVGLQARLGAGVAVQQRLVAGARRHLTLEPGELALDGQLLDAARQHVVAQGHAPLPRRALVVQRDAHALGDAQLATVDALLARDHAQQRGLAGAVATGDREPFAALQLERHAPEQGLAGNVLAQVGGGQEGHVEDGRVMGPLARARGSYPPRHLALCTSPRCIARARCISGARFDRMRRHMRRLLASLFASALLLLLLAPAALAYNDGRGFYGATNDKVITRAGFILIIFFPTFALVMSLLQWRLDKRKEARKAAQKAQLGDARWRGGW